MVYMCQLALYMYKVNVLKLVLTYNQMYISENANLWQKSLIKNQGKRKLEICILAFREKFQILKFVTIVKQIYFQNLLSTQIL